MIMISISPKKLARFALAALTLGAAPLSLHAQSISLSQTDSPIAPFGKPAVATVGQTFTTVGVFTTLDSFSFWLSNDNNVSDGLTFNASLLAFKAYIMPWSNGVGDQHALASASQSYTSTIQAGPTALSQRYDFNTGGLALSPNTQYVAFLSASDLFNSGSLANNDAVAALEGTANGAYADAGGQLVFLDNGDNLDAVTTSAWSSQSPDGNYQTHFAASFSEPVTPPTPVTITPEPASFVLLATGALGLLLVSTKRRRA